MASDAPSSVRSRPPDGASSPFCRSEVGPIDPQPERIADRPASAAVPVLDDEARRIVAAVLAGDRDAYRTLVERESRAIVRVCYRVLGDPHEAEDAAQEAFVTAFRSLSAWRGEAPFGAWLARIALRIALRSAARRRPVAWLDPAQADASDGAPSDAAREARSAAASFTAASMAAAPAHDPALLTLRAERASAVRAAVSGLDEPYREVVALRFFGDLTLAEIAAETGRPLGTVKTHLHRGLLRVRTSLEQAGVAS